jgi:hypothetical protein
VVVVIAAFVVVERRREVVVVIGLLRDIMFSLASKNNANTGSISLLALAG